MPDFCGILLGLKPCFPCCGWLKPKAMVYIFATIDLLIMVSLTVIYLPLRKLRHFNFQAILPLLQVRSIAEMEGNFPVVLMNLSLLMTLVMLGWVSRKEKPTDVIRGILMPFAKFVGGFAFLIVTSELKLDT